LKKHFTNFRKTWKKTKNKLEKLEFEKHFENLHFFQNLEKLENLFKTFEKLSKKISVKRKTFWKNLKNFPKIFRTFFTSVGVAVRKMFKKFLKMFLEIILDVSFSNVSIVWNKTLKIKPWKMVQFNDEREMHFFF
jgi:hypothetical protein